jgi:septum formation protein
MTDHPKINTCRLILASTSPYRRELLTRLTSKFDVIAPAVDETSREFEQPSDLSVRLAQLKAAAVAKLWPDAIVIGSDQVAALGTQILGKPGTTANAHQQLLACSGRTVHFFTSVCVLNLQNQFAETHTDTTTVNFRKLNPGEIDAYIKADNPLDCAGSFRAERLGVTLFDAVENRDPTAIIGLPLIWLAGSLRRAGFSPLNS